MPVCGCACLSQLTGDTPTVLPRCCLGGAERPAGLMLTWTPTFLSAGALCPARWKVRWRGCLRLVPWRAGRQAGGCVGAQTGRAGDCCVHAAIIACCAVLRCAVLCCRLHPPVSPARRQRVLHSPRLWQHRSAGSQAGYRAGPASLTHAAAGMRHALRLAGHPPVPRLFLYRGCAAAEPIVAASINGAGLEFSPSMR